VVWLISLILCCQIKTHHLVSAQHVLVKVSYMTRKACQFQPFILTKNEVEEANKTVAKALEWKMMQ